MSRNSVTPPGRGGLGAPWAAERHVCAPPADAVQRPGAGLPWPADPAARRDLGFAPWYWRVAPRLHAVQPSLVVVALVLGGLRVHDAYGTWQRAESAQLTAEPRHAAAGYAHALADERDVSVTRLVTADARRATNRARQEFWTRVATASHDLVGTAVAVAAVLLLACLAAAVTAPSVSRKLSGLRSAALEVAGQWLPTVVDQLSRTHPAHVDTEVAPSPVTSRDEIGEIARAFDQVHREAVRLATEQALLRGNVSAVTRLSCQNQRLVECQLALLDDLASRAADPRQREHLSRLDHLATRVRRNGESMPVLAGAEPGGQGTGPAPLPEVVRAAVREGAADRRIALAGVPECEIHGAVATDLVMLAELLEAAAASTTPDTAMAVAGSQLADGRIRVEVHADGLDLTAAEIADLNARLTNPPDGGVAFSPCRGLYVVGRLAEWHGIVVRLRPSGGPAGTTALVTLPAAATRAGAAGPKRAAGAGEPAVTGARTVTERGCLPAAASGRDLAWRCPPPTFGTLPPYPDPSHTESSHNSPANRWQRVGFRGLDPGVPERRVTTCHATARAGLPRRERRWQQPEAQRDGPAPRPEESLAQRAPGEVRGECGPCREGAAGGLTAAGLPRRVPRAHLVDPVARTRAGRRPGLPGP